MISNQLQEQINEEYLELYLQETGRGTDKKQTFHCISGRHEDNNPSMFYWREKKKAFCRSCHQFQNIADFISYDMDLDSISEAWQEIIHRYSIEVNKISNKERTEEKEIESEEVKLQEEIYFNDYSQKIEQLKRNEYLQIIARKHFESRGLSNMIEKYKLFATMNFNELMEEEEAKNNWKSKEYKGQFIFPFYDSQNKISYYIGEPFQRGNPKEKFKNKSLEELSKNELIEKYIKPRGTQILFNERYLQEDKQEIIFLCEGIFDSLSIEELGFKSIALMTSKSKRLEKLILKLTPQNKIFILFLDNDIEGDSGEKSLATFFKENNISYISHIENMKNNENMQKLFKYKDSNQMLVEDRETFKQYLELLTKEAQAMTETIQETEQNKIDKLKQVFSKNSIYGKIDTYFEKLNQQTFRPIPTGFSKLDEALCGGLLNQSIVTIGGGSGMGKTTFALNLAMNMIQSGRPLLYLTLETSEDIIQSKVFSNLCYKKGMSIASNNILQSYDKNKMTEYQKSKVIETLKDHQELENLFILYPKSNIIDDIVKTINEYDNLCGSVGKESPIVIIDYLQFIQGNSREDIQSLIKRTQKQLKQYSIEKNSIVLLLVANNRNSTKQGMKSSLDSGRDTSDIEYTSDYNLQLNFTEWERNPSEDISKLASAIDLKQRKPRKITLTIQKQRIGGIELIDFLYFPLENTFKEKEEEPSNTNYIKRI